MTQIAAKGLSFAYADQSIVRQISMQLCPGQVVVLLGGNGAGKTTLLKMLAGQLQPNEGEVTLDDRKIEMFSKREIAQQVALMPQHENREMELAVADVVALGRCPHRGWWLPMTVEDQTLIDEAISACGLTELTDRTVSSLSGGEWRRMILARSLAQDAPVLLLDEPTAGLDLKFQLDVLRRVKSIARDKGLSVLMTLHDLNHAATFADRIMLLAQASLLAVGSPDEVLTPKNIKTAYGVSVMSVPHPSGRGVLIVPHDDGDELNAT